MHRRELLLANVLGLTVLLVVILMGWWDAAAFGLAVLAVMDLLVFLRGRQARAAAASERGRDDPPAGHLPAGPEANDSEEGVREDG